MKDESEFPRLTPPDDRYPAHDRLLRKPEELTDDQFDLLAAAWSEEALAGDHLAELEAVMIANPSRKMRAESFSSVKLVPYDDKWAGRDMLLRQLPATRVIKRTIVISLLAAAAVVMFIITGPAIRSLTKDITPGALPEGAALSEALIPEAYPVIIPDRVKAEPVGVRSATVAEKPAGVSSDTDAEKPSAIRTAAMTEPMRTGSPTDITDNGKAISATDITDNVKAVPPADISDKGKAAHAAETTEQARTLPVSIATNAVNPVIIAAAGTTDLQAVKMNPATKVHQQAGVSGEMPSTGKESNWIFRGVSNLAKAITKEEKKIDGYYVASACVTGINNFLGWDMELGQANNTKGKAVGVKFSSSLISFSAPVNKNSP